MKAIHKYMLPEPNPDRGPQELRLPLEAKVLTVAEQGGSLWLWAEVDVDEPLKPHDVIVVGTGWPLDHVAPWMRYVGTAMAHGFVWHVYLGP